MRVLKGNLFPILLITDVIINSFDDIVYIRQFEEEDGAPQAIALSPQMWEELIAAIHSPEGAFLTVKK